MKAIENSKLNIVSVESSADLAHKALDMFVDEAQNAIAEKGVFYVAVPGGHTPRQFFELIAQSQISMQLEWDKIQLFWVDERCVGIESEDSNYRLAAETFLSKVPVSKANVHRIVADGENYIESAKNYEEQIRDVFGIGDSEVPEFDFIILGMGPDGHIGSLLPNSYALFDTDDLVCAVYQIDGGLNRITLTYPVFCAAKHLLVIISGAEKAEIVREVLFGEQDEVKYPVHTLWPILHKVTWLIDRQAGEFLSS